MVTTAQRKTIDDLHAMPDDGRLYELIRGEIVVAAAPGEPHMEAALALMFLLAPMERTHHLGKLYIAPYEVHLPTGDVVQPDLFFLRTERWSLRRGSHIEGAPDLIMEIVSPSSRLRDLVEKRRIYAAAGVQEYWIIDLQARALEALSLRDQQYERIDQAGSIVRSRLLPLFEVDVEHLFGSLSSLPAEAAGSDR
jgi:Uma2 family endonuclease